WRGEEPSTRLGVVLLAPHLVAVAGVSCPRMMEHCDWRGSALDVVASLAASSPVSCAGIARVVSVVVWIFCVGLPHVFHYAVQEVAVKTLTIGKAINFLMRLCGYSEWN
ncbi:unnamed protein product, partial [Ectocarpus sp. 12 AP-2014]